MILKESSYIEIKDRVYLFAGICDKYLQQHPVSKINPDVKSAVEDAVNSILNISKEIDRCYEKSKGESGK